MKAFTRGSVSEEEIAKTVSDIRARCEADPVTSNRQLGLADDAPLAECLARFEKLVREESSGEFWLNDKYQVRCRYLNGPGAQPMAHLSIKRLDREPVHDWRELQEIKNQLVGPECEGVELYPSESRVVDTANQYHLWVLVTPGARIPFGFFPTGTARSESPLGKSKNRRFDK